MNRTERELIAQEFNQLRDYVATHTSEVARLAGNIQNDVLETGLFTVGADGWFQRDWKVAAGSAVILNYSSATIYAANAPTVGSAGPTSGIGVHRIEAGTWLAVPVASHVMTVYATAGSVVGLQVFTGMLAFGGGSL